MQREAEKQLKKEELEKGKKATAKKLQVSVCDFNKLVYSDYFSLFCRTDTFFEFLTKDTFRNNYT